MQTSAACRNSASRSPPAPSPLSPPRSARSSASSSCSSCSTMFTSSRDSNRSRRSAYQPMRRSVSSVEMKHPWIRTSSRSEEHTSELQSPYDIVCRLLLEHKQQHRQLLRAVQHNGLSTSGTNRKVNH